MDLKNQKASVKKLSTKHLAAAFCIAAFLIVADYYVSNMTFPLFDTSSRLDFWAFLYDHDKGEESESDMLAVNLAYDKQLVETYDTLYGFLGFTPIVDRAKLLRFLTIASKADYRYIFLDVRFEKGLETESDSALFALLNSMPRIVVATHRETEDFTQNSALSSGKTGYADYRVKKGNPFSRYEFLQDGNESVALRMYSDMNGGIIEERPWGYTENGSLCYNLQFISIPKRVRTPDDESLEIRYPYLGAQIFEYYSEEELIDYLDDRIILIGDFKNDVHDTLIGEVPGPLLSYYAYKALVNGKHKVNLFLQLFMFLLYAFISYRLICNGKKVAEETENVIPQIIGFFLKASVLLWLLDALLYFVFALSFPIIIPSTVFTVLSYRKTVVYWYKKLNKLIYDFLFRKSPTKN